MFRLIRFVIAAFVFLCAQQSIAQVKSAMIGVNGLTCSACSRSVEMSIRKLNFVKDVEMNLEHTEGKIIFKENNDVDMDKVAKAVTDAGFSVRFLTATFILNNITVNDGLCFNTGKYNLQFVNTSEKKLNGESQLKFLGQEFLPKAEFNKVKGQLVNACAEKNQKVYFVTL